MHGKKIARRSIDKKLNNKITNSATLNLNIRFLVKEFCYCFDFEHCADWNVTWWMVAVVLFYEHFTLKLNNFTWNFSYIHYTYNISSSVGKNGWKNGRKKGLRVRRCSFIEKFCRKILLMLSVYCFLL